MRVAPEIVLTEKERFELSKLARSKLSSVRCEFRCKLDSDSSRSWTV